jgi:hypothetical protein
MSGIVPAFMMPVEPQLQAPTSAGELAAGPPRRPVNLRSVSVGLLGVVLICALTPFNDYVLNNTPLIGGSLPLAAAFFLFLFALIVNGPLSCLSPRRALSSAELAVVLMIVLVGCFLPASGLMQYWPATVVGPWRHMGSRPDQFESLLRNLNLPAWFWTDFPANATSVSARSNDPIVTQFYDRIPSDVPFWPALGEHLKRWLTPTLGWGVFFVAIASALLGLSFVVRKQWVEHERIPFPIAQVELALIDSPAPGRFLNATFGARPFWIGLAVIGFVRLLGGLHQYFPKYIPEIPLSYNLYDVLSDPPWCYLQFVQVQTLYPIVVAMMFFASSRIALSLWLTLAIWQVPAMMFGSAGQPLPRGFEYDCNSGSIFAIAAMIIWTGRHHYARVIRAMFRRPPADEGRDPFLSGATAGWMILGGWLLAAFWLCQVGMSPIGGLLLVLFLLLVWVVMAWAVAHSGFPTAIVRSGSRAWFGDLFPHADPKNNYQPSIVAGHFHSQAIGGMWAYSRDQLLVYGTHGLKVATERAPRAGRRLVGAVIAALIVGFAVSHVSTLYCYYRYASTQDKRGAAPINAEVLDGQPAWTVNSVLEGPHSRGGRGSHQTLGDLKWVGGSFAVTGLFAFFQLRYSWWPLHPIGLLMLFAFAIRRLWLSVLVGWLTKVLVVRFGGARLFASARPFFIGVIIGDIAAAGLFAVSAIVLYLLGVPYEVVRFLPTSQF